MAGSQHNKQLPNVCLALIAQASDRQPVRDADTLREIGAARPGRLERGSGYIAPQTHPDRAFERANEYVCTPVRLWKR